MYVENHFVRTGGIAAAIFFMTLSGLAAETPNPSWTPKSSERLIKLPMNYLKKSIDQDFNNSQLGRELGETEKNITAKGGTLQDLQATIKQVEKPEIKMELQHQLLNEKRAFIDLMSRKVELKRQHVNTKLKMFEDMMEKLAPEKRGVSPGRAELIDKQTAARTRFSKSLADVDLKLFESHSAPRSKYAAKYDQNRRAIERLMRHITDHKANQAPVDHEGLPISKSEYVRQMISEAQAELALVDQESTILGYMAKLTNLDALALSEKVMEHELADNETPDEMNASGAIDYFLSN